MDRLTAILEFFNKRKTFEWGTRDCCMWVADILKCKTGIDYAETLRGRYTTATGFKKLLILEGKANLLELIISVLGDPKPGWSAVKGEPVLLFEREEYLLGMCYGTYALFLTEQGFTRRSILSCKHSWEV